MRFYMHTLKGRLPARDEAGEMPILADWGNCVMSVVCFLGVIEVGTMAWCSCGGCERANDIGELQEEGGLLAAFLEGIQASKSTIRRHLLILKDLS